MQKIYQGKLTLIPDHLDTAGVLCLSENEEWDMINDDPLAETISDDIHAMGSNVIVMCRISTSPLHTDNIEITFNYEGKGEARYSVHYDEMDDRSIFDGYVEFFDIITSNQTYDIINNLKKYAGQYLYMTIDYK